jgi:hypothetical protein
MGIVRPSGRESVRLLTQACAREGQRAWTAARGMGEWAVGFAAPAMACGADHDARQTASDQTRVCRDATPAPEGARAS